MALRIQLIFLPFCGIVRTASSAECLLNDECSVLDLRESNQTDLRQQLLLVHSHTQRPPYCTIHLLTSGNNEDSTWSDIGGEMETEVFDSFLELGAQESWVTRTAGRPMVVWMHLLVLVLVAWLWLVRDARRRRFLEEEEQRKERLRCQRAACLEQLKQSNVHNSDAFTAREKGLLLKTMAALEEREDAQAFECAICYETCFQLAPTHSHGSTCTDCQRRSADLAVESGRFPECPICRERLSLKDLASIGASNRTHAYVQDKVRQNAHEALLEVVQSTWDALGETEMSDLSQLLNAFGPSAGSGKTHTRLQASSQDRVWCE